MLKQLDVVRVRRGACVVSSTDVEVAMAQEKLASEVAWMQAAAEQLPSPVVMCHNDMLSANLITVRAAAWPVMS